MEPKVAIILVNYNGYEDTVECVNSLLAISYKNMFIFVVDNASTEGNRIQEDVFLQKAVRIIQSKENLGFSGGNNLAIQIALKEKFDYVLLLNNDTSVEPDFLSEMIEAAENNHRVGIVAGKIYFYHDKNRIWAAGGQYNRRTGLTVQYGGVDRRELNVERDVTFATGCLMLIPCEVIHKVGLLDESFFLYSEDTDYCQRVIDAGYKIRYVPTAKIYHKVSASIGNTSSMQQQYMMRNNLYMIKKYSKVKVVAYISMLFQAIKDIIRKRKNLKPIIQGVMDYICGNTGKI